MEISARLMGSNEFDGNAFREQIEQIIMRKDGHLEFIFTDGHTETTEYSTKRQSPGWSAERRAAFEAKPRKVYTEEERKAMSEKMKKIRSERYWNSKRK